MTTSTKQGPPRPSDLNPQPDIDPRIRARRVEVQRSAGRRRLRRLGWTAIVLALVSAAVLVATGPALDIDHVRVEGAAQTGTATATARSGLTRGDRMLTVPLDRAARRLLTLPWVGEASVTRRWPGTVVLTIVERRPVAAVPAEGGGRLLLDAEARQLAVVAELPAGVLPVEVAPVPARLGQVLDEEREALAVAAAVPDVLRDRLLALRPQPGDRLEGVVRLRDGATAVVRLCTAERIAAKWLALVTLLEAAVPARLATIDVCVPGSPVVTRR